MQQRRMRHYGSVDGLVLFANAKQHVFVLFGIPNNTSRRPQTSLSAQTTISERFAPGQNIRFA